MRPNIDRSKRVFAALVVLSVFSFVAGKAIAARNDIWALLGKGAARNTSILRVPDGSTSLIIGSTNTMATAGDTVSLKFSASNGSEVVRFRAVTETLGQVGLAIDAHASSTTGERVRIDGKGNVGIGSTSPGAALNVVGSIAALGTTLPVARITGAIAGYTGNGLITENTLGASSTFNLFEAATDSDGDSGGRTTQFLIRGDGKVGIGLSVPVVSLQAGNSTNSIGLESRNDGPGIGGVATGNLGRLGGFYQSNPIPGAAVILGAQGASGQRGAIGFSVKNTDDDTNQPAYAMVLTAEGRLGVGISTPTTKMHMSSGIFTLDGTTPYVTFQTVTSSPTAVSTQASIWANTEATAEMKVIDGAGNVTKISPHNASGDWVFYSENVITGKRVYVNMEKFIKRMEKISGEQFLFESEAEANNSK